MNLPRLAFASLAAFLAYFVVGGVVFVMVPSLKKEFLKYPAVHRDHEGQVRLFPVGMAGMSLSIGALTVLYAMLANNGSGLANGIRFGALIGVFFVGSFVIHNYVNLNIGLKLSLQQAVAYFSEWLIVGIVISVIYRPAAP